MSELARERLSQLGAEAFPHVSGSLARHLRGTETLLRCWGSREALCLAGLYHAVYGTAGIRGSLASLEMRPGIAETIGAEAERLAYLYGACDRETFHPRIGTTMQRLFADRFARAEYPITLDELRDFCELTIANELELAQESDAFRAEYGEELIAFFARMPGLASTTALDAARTVLR